MGQGVDIKRKANIGSKEQGIHRVASAVRTAKATLEILGLALTLSYTGCLSPDGTGDVTDGADPAGETTRIAPCSACAPPFVEKLGSVEFSGRLIVRPNQRIAADRARAARDHLASYVVKHYSEVDEYVIDVPKTLGQGVRGGGENQLAANLMATGDYEYAVPDWIVYPIRTPNDPSFPTQWHHPKIQSQQAWDRLIGTWPAQPRLMVAVTDTGIDTTHADLAANRVPGFNAVTGLTEAAGGAVNDLNGHGTHVAGIAAAIGHNATGVTGAGWNFLIMMVRVSDDAGGGSTISILTSGARWAVSDPDPAKRAKVVSTSYSGVESPSVGTTGTFIRSQGSLYMWAAGNNNRELNAGADWPDVIIVGATDQVDARAGFSNFGAPVDVAAPGVNIFATFRGGGYGFLSGTSMATPLANGVAALTWAVNTHFTPAEVEGFLFNGTDDLGAAGDDAIFGRGRINAFKSVELARAAACSHDRCTIGAALGDGCSAQTAIIAAADSSCAKTAWSASCVNAVQTVTNSLICPASQGTCSHTLCSTGAALAPGCDAPPAASSCVAAIGAVDPFCTTTAWDGICVGEVTTVCGKNCN
jgi:subtilisin family serine protease